QGAWRQCEAVQGRQSSDETVSSSKGPSSAMRDGGAVKDYAQRYTRGGSGGAWASSVLCKCALCRNSTAPDRLQPSLLRRCGFRQQGSASVRVCRDKPAQC